MPESEPPIIHADLDAFYASVEQRDDPALLGRPVIVGGGVVLAASYEARARGVRTAMGTARARALCPDAVVVPPRFEAYSAASREAFVVLRRFSPHVEPLSIDEAFLDVRGLGHIIGTPREIAVLLRQAVLREVGLTITVGLASTKFLAKVASAVAKPDGLLVVAIGSEAAFLHPLPIGRLWGVGPVTAARLRSLGLTTVAEVAALDQDTLMRLLGAAAGRRLYALTRNHDPRPVLGGRRRRSIGAQRALRRRARAAAEVDVALLTLVDRVARRLRAAGRACRTIVLRLRFGDFTRATRSRTLAEATERTATLLRVARELLRAAGELIECKGLTLIGVALTNLCDRAAVQLALGFDRSGELDQALDSVRDRFGAQAVRRGSLVGLKEPSWVPLLPDA